MEALSAQQPQFTCFTGTKVGILTLLSAQPQWVPWFTVDGNPLVSSEQIAANDTTGTIVQILTMTANATTAFDSQMLLGSKLCLLALLVQKYKY